MVNRLGRVSFGFGKDSEGNTIRLVRPCMCQFCYGWQGEVGQVWDSEKEDWIN